MQKFLEKHHIYYGWVMVVAGILVMSVTHGVVQNCFSQFIKPVSESLNVSRSSFAINMTILNVVYMIVALFSGKIFVKLKLRNLMRIACVALPIIYFSYSFCREMWMFYALSVAAGLMMSCLTFLAFTMIISQWFIEKRGTAIGVCFMGSGLGGMLFQNLSNSWIKTVGWAGTYRILAVIMAAVMIPLVYFVIRQRPQDMGLQPYGSQIEEAGGEEPVYGPTLGGAMKSFSFWALIVLAISVGLSTTMLSQTIVPHLGDIGFTTEWDRCGDLSGAAGDLQGDAGWHVRQARHEEEHVSGGAGHYGGSCGALFRKVSRSACDGDRGGGAGLCVGHGVLPVSGTVGLRHAGLCDDLRHRQRGRLAGQLHQPVVFQPRL